MRTCYLVGPREPSGLSWLYNCLLCLGVKVHYVHYRNQGEMWLPDGNGYVLNPIDDIQKKWAPILNQKKRFQFRDDIQIEFGHEWPTGWQRGATVLFFVRNPMDALCSRWRRDSEGLSFDEFLRFPDHLTMLDKIDNWNLFCEAWLAQRKCTRFHLVRFEDYRANANLTLRSVVSFLNLQFSDSEIEYALEQSTFERARTAEQDYIPSIPNWLKVCDDIYPLYTRRLINRGSVNNTNSNEIEAIKNTIRMRTSAVCREFGYHDSVKSLVSPSYLPQKAMLSFYTHLDLSDEWFSECVELRIEDHMEELEELFTYIRDVSCLLSRAGAAGLSFGEVAAFCAALQEMYGKYMEMARPR